MRKAEELKTRKEASKKEMETGTAYISILSERFSFLPDELCNDKTDWKFRREQLKNVKKNK